ncbi:MAG: DUF971 domain-containing protein [Bacteroidota bacterium]
MLKSLKRNGENSVLLQWEDGHEGPLALKSLREACPCAECMGETVLLREYKPRPAALDTPGRYDLTSATTVGNYAMQFSWGDRHTLGIYTWELLRSLCECKNCLGNRQT